MGIVDGNTLGILGDRHTGKTNLLFRLGLAEYSGSSWVLYNYPDASIIDTLKGFGKSVTCVYNIQQLSFIKNSLILIDELQTVIKFYDKATNNKLLELLSLLAHNGNSVLFTTPLSQFITRSLDGFIDGFAFTRIFDLGSIKNGSKAKRLLQLNNGFRCNTGWSLDLSLGESLILTPEYTNLFRFEKLTTIKAFAQKNAKINLKKRRCENNENIKLENRRNHL